MGKRHDQERAKEHAARRQALAEQILEQLDSIPSTEEQQAPPDPLKVGAPVTNHGGATQLHVALQDPTIKARFRIVAAEHGTSMSHVVNLFVTAFVNGELDLPADQ